MSSCWCLRADVGSFLEDELQKDLGDAGHGAANGLQCEEALPEDDVLAGQLSWHPSKQSSSMLPESGHI